MAYCLRWRKGNNYTGQLTIEEIKRAEIQIIKAIQTNKFPNELKELKNNQTIKSNRIINLSPFLDQDGLIRVGGRLPSSNLNFQQKYPILLPSKNHNTDQIIREIHETRYHTGIQTTLYHLRQKFWVLDGRNQVRKIIRSCTRCFRFDAATMKYKMGNLPPARIKEAIPFENTGVDFYGPFFIKEKKFRNRNKIKAYVCVFICMVIKAVHLEVVSDLSTDSFLAALRRFVARRGIPKHIYSDNGTNFVGANNELREIYTLLNSDKHKNLVNNYANKHHITWHFIPPVAPHFDGLWESTVKQFKHHFKRVVGNCLLTFEELSTFSTEIEGILNSRPITTLSSDPNDTLAITPAHYLIGKPLTTLPEENLQSIPSNRLSIWQHISKIRQDFWTRWHLEYLNELQHRAKWKINDQEPKIGMIVLIKDKNTPCMQWSLGKIIKLYTGEDNITRTVDVKTSTGIVKRTTRCLCPLPIWE
ncbi:uncharacterized protein [Cardiocondyla obscurior]|uniref:uncharacterized protein n=1 Tax=Cardiocondyla obscurior TaxID=286306 RepID=UPI003965674B